MRDACKSLVRAESIVGPGADVAENPMLSPTSIRMVPAVLILVMVSCRERTA